MILAVLMYFKPLLSGFSLPNLVLELYHSCQSFFLTQLVLKGFAS